MLLGVMPQVAPNYLSYALLRFEINIRASAILGFVGAGGIGYELRNHDLRHGQVRPGGRDLHPAVPDHRRRRPGVEPRPQRLSTGPQP
jgi:hypothetical protein